MARRWARYGAAFIAASGLFTIVACSGRTTRGSSSTSACGTLTLRLRICGLLSSGEFRCQEPQTAEDRCMHDCLFNRSCADLRQLFCSGSGFPSFLACDVDCMLDFLCADGTSVRGSFRCDSYPDCNDGSDEIGCPSFDCGDGTTVSEGLQCDALPDCANGRDEAVCPTFSCASGETVPADLKCDGAADCSDASDEAGCPETAQITC